MQIADIEPVYFSLMINYVMIGVIAFLYLKLLCPDLKLGLGKDGLADGLKKYGVIGISVALAGFAIIEELYVRGRLLIKEIM